MKNVNTLLIVLALLLSTNLFSQKYLLKDQGEKRLVLTKMIDLNIKEDKLDKNPVIVINERVIPKEKQSLFSFKASDILEVSIIAKGNEQMVIIYGEQSINGVVLIETKPLEEEEN